MKTLEELETGDSVEFLYKDEEDVIVFAIKQDDDSFKDVAIFDKEGVLCESSASFVVDERYTYIKLISSVVKPFDIIKNLYPEYYV